MAGESDVCANLEKIINTIESAKEKVDSSVVASLEKAQADAKALGMKSGESLIGNLLGKVKELTDGKTTMDSVGIRITALQFYINTVKKDGEAAAV